MKVRIKKDIHIEAPTDVVWSFVDDPAKELEWRGPVITELERVGEGPIRRGTRYRGKAKIGPGEPDPYTNEITAVRPARVLTWRTVEAESPVGGGGSYRLDPVDGGTRMELDLLYEGYGPAGNARLPMIRMTAPAIVGRFLRRLKRAAEEEAA